MDRNSAPYILALGIAWGLNVVFSRFGVSQFAPSIFVGLRFAVTVAIFAAVYAFSSRRQWSREPALWRNGIVTGIIGTAAPFICFTTALQYQSAGLTALLVTTSPAILVTIAHFALSEARLTRTTIFGVTIALSGAVLIVVMGESGLPDVSQANPLGYGLVFLALILDACTYTYIRKYMSSVNTFDFTSIRMLTATVLILPMAFWLNPADFQEVNLLGWGALLVTAVISTFVAQLLSFYIISTFGTTAMAMVGYIIPLVAITLGVVLLGETITSGIFAGMILIISGILMVNQQRRHQQQG